jgi:hypothetical protein
VQAKEHDTVVWTNKDTAVHTVTSGTSATPDGKFGVQSDKTTPILIPPGKTFQFTFDESGDFPYFCMLHPAMVGTVKVASEGGGGGGGGGTTGGQVNSVSVQDSAGNKYTVVSMGDGTRVTGATLMPAQHKVGVDFQGAGQIELVLPKNMVSGIYNVTASNGTVIPHQEVSSNATATTIRLTIPQGQTHAEINAATVVPEFGVIAALVLAASLAAMIAFARFRGGNGSLGLGRSSSLP